MTDLFIFSGNQYWPALSKAAPEIAITSKETTPAPEITTEGTS